MEKHEIKTLKKLLLIFLYALMLILCFMGAGQLILAFPEVEMIEVIANIFLAVHFALATAAFIYSFRKVSKE